MGDQDQAVAYFIQAGSNLHRLRITSVWADGVVIRAQRCKERSVVTVMSLRVPTHRAEEDVMR